MDIIQQYADHQTALMRADSAHSAEQRRKQFAAASQIAGQISAFQRSLGAAAASAWNTAQRAAARQS